MTRAYQVRVNGKELAVTLIERSGSRIAFETNGNRYDVDVAPLLETRAVAAGAATISPPVAPSRRVASARPGEITSPIPGIINKINVNVGDTVTLGQQLLVIEAMKMENSITASSAGIVERIEVREGSQVNTGQVLLSIRT